MTVDPDGFELAPSVIVTAKSAAGGVVVVGGMVVVVGARGVVGAGAALPTCNLIVVPGSTDSPPGMLCEITMPSWLEPVATGTGTTFATSPFSASWFRAAASVRPSTGGTFTLAGPAETINETFDPVASGVLTAGSVRNTVSAGTVAFGSEVTVTSNL